MEKRSHDDEVGVEITITIVESVISALSHAPGSGVSFLQWRARQAGGGAGWVMALL